MTDDSPQRGTIGDDANVRVIQRAWDILFRHPHLLGWRVLGNLVGMAIRPAGVLVALIALSSGLVAAGWNPESPLSVLGALRSVDPVQLGVGLVGLAATVGLVGLAVEALVTGGIWSTITRDLQSDDGADETGFGAEMLRGFPRALQVSLVGVAIQWCMFLLFGMLAVAVGSAFIRGRLWAGPTVLQVVMLAVPLFLYLVLAALTRLVVEITAAAIFLEEIGIGEAVAEAARFVVWELASLYRVLARAFGYLLVPLFGFWGFGALANLAAGPQSAMAVLQAGRVTGQVLTTVAFALVTLLLQGAFFTYWAAVHAEEPGAIVDLRERDDEDERRGSGWDLGTRLRDLLPERTPYVDRVD